MHYLREGDYFMKTIERIVALLEEKDIVPAKMMKELGFSNGLFSQWKSGLQNPSAEKVFKIADYLGCSTDYLLGRTDNPNVTGSAYINGDNNNNVNQAINGDVNVNTDTTEHDDQQLLEMIKSLNLVERSETIVYINNLKKKEGE